MRLDTLLRFCHHLSLALACTCLLQSERQYLPSPEQAMVPVALIILLAFVSEGRWSIPNRLANLLGVLIMIGGVWWIVLQIYDPTGLVVLPLPTGLVPHLGPILMALLLVKLFRPQQPADFWVLQGIGLLQVALACVLASDPLFGVFLAAYLCSGLLTLALHHAHLHRQTAPASEPHTHGLPRMRVASLLVRLVVWTLLVGLTAGALYLATPRGAGPSWDPYARFGFAAPAGFALTGFNDAIDLNRVGDLELDDEAAFTVTATTANGLPKTDLSPGQRWRGAILDKYRNGRWFPPDRFYYGPSIQRLNRTQPAQLPDLGREQFYLHFQVQPRRAGGLFLAEPVQFGEKGTHLPVIAVAPSPTSLFVAFSGTLLPHPTHLGRHFQYRQVVAPLASPDRVPAAHVGEPYLKHIRSRPDSEEIVQWTEQLLKRLAANGLYGLTPADARRPPVPKGNADATVPADSERIARALCHYLAQSGDFTYTLELRRQDLNADPALDFLENVKQGHCERFASGLVLMLRSCGIPARIVKGFRGADHQGDGLYVIRQRDSHSWVEALVPHPVAPEAAARIIGWAAAPASSFQFAAGSATVGWDFDWLLLDPTPETESTPRDGFSLWRWAASVWKRKDLLWQDLVLNFSADQQADLWSGLTDGNRTGKALMRLALGVGSLLLGTWLTWRLFCLLPRRRLGRRPRESQPPARPFWLTRLYALLHQHLGVQPDPGRTPREIAAVAGNLMREHAFASKLADLPSQVVELYYRSRYGRCALTDTERASVEADLANLESALRTRRLAVASVG